jgi:hypothetical protein
MALEEPAVEGNAVRRFERDVLWMKSPRYGIIVQLLLGIEKERAAS